MIDNLLVLASTILGSFLHNSGGNPLATLAGLHDWAFFRGRQIWLVTAPHRWHAGSAWHRLLGLGQQHGTMLFPCTQTPGTPRTGDIAGGWCAAAREGGVGMHLVACATITILWSSIHFILLLL